MKSLRFLGIVVTLFIIATTPLKADYLIVSKSAKIKDNPSSKAKLVVQVEVDSYLELISNDQTNGYYNVKVPGKPYEGWIYRTFVRRYKGSIPPTDDNNQTENATDGQLDVRVIDVGPSLCLAIKLPDNHYIIFDAGHYRGSGKSTLNQLSEVIPIGSTIDLLILSHTDGDHVGAASNILEGYIVKKVLDTGFDQVALNGGENSSAYTRFKDALGKVHYPLKYVNLNSADSIIPPGTTEKYGDVSLVYLCGFGKPPKGWDLKTNAERINSVSIVAKLMYKGSSILLCGDAVGRHEGDPPTALIATEKYLVENASGLLSSDVIIAPHHGADNASSTAFVERVKPKYVVFSAGHEYHHPSRVTAQRYLKYVDINSFYRTDRGDDESIDGKEDKEWNYLRVTGCSDSYGDDDIDIVITPNGKIKISYLTPNGDCRE